MRKSFLAVGAAVILLAASACSGGGSSTDASGSSGAAATGGTFTISPVIDHYPWDLAAAGLGNDVTYYEAVYDSLLRTDNDGKPTPNLATSWTYDDAKTALTLKLRTDVKFTDGTVFDAEAVKANLLHNKKGTDQAAGQLANLTDVTVVDPSTVTITLSAADPDFLTSMGTTPGMMASPKIIDSPDYKTTPVGSGPYTLDKANTTEGSVYTFVRNPNYWNKAAFPYDSVVMKPLLDPTAMLNALRSGQTDAGIVTDSKLMAPAQAAGLNVSLLAATSVNGLYLWDRGGTINPAIGNVKVRQALNYAFDRSSISQVLAPDGVGVPTAQNFAPTSTGFDQSLEDKYPFDVTKAKQLLAEAGYPNGFTLSIPIISGQESSPAFATLKQSLADVGVTVDYQSLPVDQWITAINTGKYAAAWFILQGAPSGAVVKQQAAAAATYNPLHYTTPEMETLLKNVQTAPSDEDLTSAYKAVNDYMVDQAWNAPWYAAKTAFITTSSVQFENPTDRSAFPLWNFKPAG